jgi:hypothetical protein
MRLEEDRGARNVSLDELKDMERIRCSPNLHASASYRAQELSEPPLLARASGLPSLPHPRLIRVVGRRSHGLRAGGLAYTFPLLGIGCEKRATDGSAELIAGRVCASGWGGGDGAMRAVRVRGERASDGEEQGGGSGS